MLRGWVWSWFKLFVAYSRRVIELLTTEQVAKELGVSTGRVRQLVRVGRLRPEPVTPRIHLFSREAVESYKGAPKPARGRPKKS
ncbi:helix-turn-helix domain-containing protein [Deinococcus sp. 6YEL10]|uniref:helix-turn-helix domain-containing protein n=1 Tax=Deinococcus sp. 6YEL10 TaxID=2745870 RepID=UPI00351D020C